MKAGNARVAHGGLDGGGNGDLDNGDTGDLDNGDAGGVHVIQEPVVGHL